MTRSSIAAARANSAACRRAKALATASECGNSGDPNSPHFKDQAERYAAGNLRQVYFHANELRGHVERRYKPGR